MAAISLGDRPRDKRGCFRRVKKKKLNDERYQRRGFKEKEGGGDFEVVEESSETHERSQTCLHRRVLSTSTFLVTCMSESTLAKIPSGWGCLHPLYLNS